MWSKPFDFTISNLFFQIVFIIVNTNKTHEGPQNYDF